jgi:hypothetical protein
VVVLGVAVRGVVVGVVRGGAADHGGSVNLRS